MRGAPALLITLGCGGLPVESPLPEGSVTPPPIEISPNGARFRDSLQVRLLAEDGVAAWYSLDGTEPLPHQALAYRGPFELTETVLVRAMGVGPDGGWSELSSALFEQAEAEIQVDPVERALTVDRAQLVFAVGPEIQWSAKTLVLSSRGTEAVTIEDLEIVSDGSGFYEDGVFQLIDPPRGERLEPGGRLLLEVGYRSTRVIRSAELGILTDGSSPRDGRVSVQLSGRMFP